MARLGNFGGFLILVLVLATGLVGCAGASQKEVYPTPPPSVDLLGEQRTKRLGWHRGRLADAYDYARTLSTDTLLIVTEGETVGALGDLRTPYSVHSVRKALLSALVGQNSGSGAGRIPLEATLADLGIDDAPNPLTPLQKQVTVRHLIKSVSGVNHAAAAEGGLMDEKNRRLGFKENQPGTIWAYNNWDYNTLTTIFETRTGTTVAGAFRTGIAEPLGMQDYSEDAVSYVRAPKVSRHAAAMFRMSGRDLARFGRLYLDRGMAKGKRIVPEGWIDLVTSDYSSTGNGGLGSGHGYLWWIPAPSTGLPDGTFWASGFGRQAVFVIPAWRTVIVHQSDTRELMKRFWKKVREEGLGGMTALESIIFSCMPVEASPSEFCRRHRFITGREFSTLIRKLAAARL